MKQIKAITVFSFAFLLVAILFEFLLSGGGILTPLKKIYPDKGERYYPNKMYSSIFISEGFGLAKTNSSGWFGKDFSDKGENDVSIAVLGNSFVVSRQVFYRDNFLSIAENDLNKQLINKHAAFFNFGLEGINIKELLYLKNEVVTENNPDYMIILLRDGNFSKTEKNYAPFCEYQNGRFMVDSSFKQKPFVKNYHKFHLLAESSVLFMSYRTKNHFPRAGEIIFDKFYLGKKEAHSDENEGAAADTLSAVDKAIINELSKDKRIIFMLDVSVDKTDQLKLLLANSPVIDLKIPLQKMKEKGVDPNYWPIPEEKGHWTIPAHKMIGEEISKKMLIVLNQ
jgi:hypothetical protein